VRVIYPAVIAALLASTPAAAVPGWRAVDGDTIISPAGERIRIANIDAAEMHCHWAVECNPAYQAKAITQEHLSHAHVIALRPYERNRDRSGRTLAYVVVDGRDLGDLLIERGLARRWTGRRLPWCADPNH
jgi:micrococcal nuclease